MMKSFGGLTNGGTNYTQSLTNHLVGLFWGLNGLDLVIYS